MTPNNYFRSRSNNRNINKIFEKHEDRYNPQDSEEFAGYEDGEPDYEKFNSSSGNYFGENGANTFNNRHSKRQTTRSNSSYASSSSTTNRKNTRSKNKQSVNSLKQLSAVSADDIDEDYIKEDALSIDNDYNAGTEVELDKVDIVHEFDDFSDSEAPIKETEFTNQILTPTNQAARYQVPHRLQTGFYDVSTDSVNFRREQVLSKLGQGSSSTFSKARKYEKSQTPWRQKRRASVQEYQNELDDEIEDDNKSYSENDFTGHSMANSSRAVSVLENYPVDEELTMGVIQDVFSSISDKIASILKTMHDYFFRVWDFLSQFSMTAVTLVPLAFAVFLYIIISFFSKSSTSSSYVFTHPNGAPENINSFSGRLVTVEGQISKLSRQAFDSESNENKLKKHMTELQAKLAELTKGMAKFDLKIDSVRDSNTQAKNKLSDVEQTVKEIEEKLSHTHKYILEEQALGKLRDDKINNGETRIADVSSVVENINDKMETLKARVKHLEDAKRIEEIVVKTIDKILPPKLVVSVDSSTGDIHPTPEFWQFLQATFSSALEQSSHLEDKIKSVLQKYPTLDALRIPKDVSAEEYHEHTQKAAKASLEKFFNNQKDSLSGTAVVTRNTFTKVIRQEVEKMREFTIESIATLEEKMKQEFKSLEHKATSEFSQHNKKEDNGENMLSKMLLNGSTLALDSLIKKSIEKHYLHTISKPDFADLASGSRINSRLTSPGYDWKSKLPLWERQWRTSLDMIGFGRMKVNPPSTAFNNDVALGSCWPFNGPSGHIGLSLASEMSPSDLGIVHINVDQSSNPTSAPRRVSLWVEVNDPELRKQVSLLIDQSPSNVIEAEQKQQQQGIMGLVFQQFKIPENYVKILTAEYDLLGNQEFQVFPVSAAVQQLGITTRNVLFNIESNWGHSEFTCVYRLRLFGHSTTEPLSALKQQEYQQQRRYQEEHQDTEENEGEYSKRVYYYADEQEYTNDEEFVDSIEDPVEEDEFYIHARELDSKSKRYF